MVPPKRRRGLFHSVKNVFRRREKIAELLGQMEKFAAERARLEMYRETLLAILSASAAENAGRYRSTVGKAQAQVAEQILDTKRRISRIESQIARLRKLGKKK